MSILVSISRESHCAVFSDSGLCHRDCFKNIIIIMAKEDYEIMVLSELKQGTPSFRVQSSIILVIILHVLYNMIGQVAGKLRPGY